MTDTTVTPNPHTARVVVAVPTTGRVHHAAGESIRRLIHTTQTTQRIELWWHNAQPHDRCRNALLNRFMGNREWTHILFIDTDVVVDADAVDRFLAHDAPIVCAPVPLLCRRLGPKEADTGITVGTNIMLFENPQLRGTIIDPTDTEVGYRYADPDDIPAEEPFHCDASGLGLCLIRRDVIEAIEPPWCKFVGHTDDEYVGEDVYFMRQARAAGFDILVDPTIRCDHFKSIDLTHLDMLFAEAPPVSPWPAWQTPDREGNVMVAVRVPYTGWLDIRTIEVLQTWEREYGDRLIVERIFADSIRGGMQELAERVRSLPKRFRHILFLNDDVVPHESTLGLLAAIDAPIVSGLTRALNDGTIRWSFFNRDSAGGKLAAPQNISLPEINEPFCVDSIDPACVLCRPDTLTHVDQAVRQAGSRTDADQTFAHLWCQAVTDATQRKPVQAPLTVERKAEVGLRGMLELKMRLKAQLRAASSSQPQAIPV